MDQVIGSALGELCINENGRTGRKRRNKRDENEPYKSKNLVAERNRRQKLHDKLREEFFWNGMMEDCMAFCKACVSC